MKKWSVYTLIVAIALLGFLSKDQTVVPNQQIILQFTDHNVSSDKAQNTISTVKEQLYELGVKTIKVEKQSEGKLKISYYSTIDIARIKTKLSNERTLDFNAFSTGSDHPELPNDNNGYDYNVHVYKILDGNDSDLGLDGRFVLEPKLESDRFFNPSVYFFVTQTQEEDSNKIAVVAYKVQRHIAMTLDNISHNIPEVRAGPYHIA